MVKFALKNIKFLEKVSKIPILKHFFILKISKNFSKIKSDLVLQKFYKDIYVSNQTSKKTHKKRFTDLDKISLKYLKQTENIIIHDIAVSNGISSVELNNLLNKNNIKHSFTISDKFAEVFIKIGFITKVFSTENNLLFAYFGFLFAVDKNIFFPLTVLLFNIIKKQKLIDDADYSLLLLHPETLSKIDKNEISFINYDIFQTKIYEQYNFIRIMNILNLSYFNEEMIIKGIENIILSLKEGGILLIGRTNSQNINNASFFKKENGKLINLEDINKGSEIKYLIERL